MTFALLAFQTMWNELALSLLLIPRDQDRLVTPTVALMQGRFATNEPLLMAGLLVATVPSMLAVAIFARYLERGRPGRDRQVTGRRRRDAVGRCRRRRRRPCVRRFRASPSPSTGWRCAPGPGGARLEGAPHSLDLRLPVAARHGACCAGGGAAGARSGSRRATSSTTTVRAASRWPAARRRACHPFALMEGATRCARSRRVVGELAARGCGAWTSATVALRRRPGDPGFVHDVCARHDVRTPRVIGGDGRRRRRRDGRPRAGPRRPPPTGSRAARWRRRCRRSGTTGGRTRTPASTTPPSSPTPARPAAAGLDVAVLDAGWFGPVRRPATRWYDVRGDWDTGQRGPLPARARAAWPPTCTRSGSASACGSRWRPSARGRGCATDAARPARGRAAGARRAGAGGRRRGARPRGPARRPRLRVPRQPRGAGLGVRRDRRPTPNAAGSTGSSSTSTSTRASAAPGTTTGTARATACGRTSRGLYALLDRLRAAFPGLLVEACASGGLRWDHGLARHVDVGFQSDPDWPEHALQVLWAASLFFPLETAPALVRQRVARRPPAAAPAGRRPPRPDRARPRALRGDARAARAQPAARRPAGVGLGPRRASSSALHRDVVGPCVAHGELRRLSEQPLRRRRRRALGRLPARRRRRRAGAAPGGGLPPGRRRRRLPAARRRAAAGQPSRGRLAARRQHARRRQRRADGSLPLELAPAARAGVARHARAGGVERVRAAAPARPRRRPGRRRAATSRPAARSRPSSSYALARPLVDDAVAARRVDAGRAQRDHAAPAPRAGRRPAGRGRSRSSVACRASGSAPAWSGRQQHVEPRAAQRRRASGGRRPRRAARPRGARRPSRPCRPSAPTGRRSGSSRPGSAAAGPRRPCSWSTSPSGRNRPRPARATRLGRARAQSSPMVVSWRATIARSMGLPPFQQFSTTSHGWRSRSSPSSAREPGGAGRLAGAGVVRVAGRVAARDGLEVVQQPGQLALARRAGRPRPAPTRAPARGRGRGRGCRSEKIGVAPRQRGEPVRVLADDRRAPGWALPKRAPERQAQPEPLRLVGQRAAGRRRSARWGASRRRRAPSPCRR